MAVADYAVGASQSTNVTRMVSNILSVTTEAKLMS